MSIFVPGSKARIVATRKEMEDECGLGWVYSDMMENPVTVVGPSLSDDSIDVRFFSAQFPPPHGRVVWVLRKMLRKACPLKELRNDES